MAIPTSVSPVEKIGAGTELQMNFGTTAVPDWRLIVGVSSSGEWGHDQEFIDATDLSELDRSSIAGEAQTKELLITMKHKPGDADQKSFLDRADANEEVHLREVKPTGFIASGVCLLAKPYYSASSRSEFGMASVKATPQGGIVYSTIV